MEKAKLKRATCRVLLRGRDEAFFKGWRRADYEPLTFYSEADDPYWHVVHQVSGLTVFNMRLRDDCAAAVGLLMDLSWELPKEALFAAYTGRHLIERCIAAQQEVDELPREIATVAA